MNEEIYQMVIEHIERKRPGHLSKETERALDRALDEGHLETEGEAISFCHMYDLMKEQRD